MGAILINKLESNLKNIFYCIFIQVQSENNKNYQTLSLILLIFDGMYHKKALNNLKSIYRYYKPKKFKKYYSHNINSNTKMNTPQNSSSTKKPTPSTSASSYKETSWSPSWKISSIRASTRPSSPRITSAGRFIPKWICSMFIRHSPKPKSTAMKKTWKEKMGQFEVKIYQFGTVVEN